MAEFPAMPLWTDAYLGDTTHLSTIEHGTFLLLLITMWRAKENTLPDDDKLLARYARLTAGQWRRIRPVIEPLFKIESGAWRNSRLMDEVEAVRRRVQQRSNAGKASAMKRKHRGSTAVQRNVNENSTPTPTPIPKSSEAKASGVSTPADPAKIMFDSIVRLLTEAGHTERQARSLGGKWKARHGVEAVIVAAGKAQREGAIDPVAFIEGCFRRQSSNGQRREIRDGQEYLEYDDAFGGGPLVR